MSLIPDFEKKELPPEAYVVHEVPMVKIFADHTWNFRGHIAPIDVKELAASIADKGLQTPITLQPYPHPTRPEIEFRIVAGHRRHLASRLNDAQTIKAFIRTGLSEDDARELNLSENLERKELNLKQESFAIEYFLKRGWTEEKIAYRFGQSRGWVQIRKAFLTLPQLIQDEAAAGIFSQAEVKLIARCRSKEEMLNLARRIKERKESGEKVKVSRTIKRADDALKVKKRQHGEMVEMNEYLYDTIGPCLVTRVLAWAAGEISTAQLMISVQEYCKEEDLPFSMPEFIRNALSGVADKQPVEMRLT